MQFTFTLMDEMTARAILTWQYAEPYTVYNMVGDGLADGEGARLILVLDNG